MRRAVLAVVLAVTAWGYAPARAQYFPFGKNREFAGAPAWQTVSTARFDLYFPVGSEDLAHFAGIEAEKAIDEAVRLFRDPPEHRIPLLVFPDQDAFLGTNAVDLPPVGEAIGGVTERYKNRIAVPFNGDHRAFARVVRHEVVHALVNDRFFGGSLQSALHRTVPRIPPWFGEGLAEYVAYGTDGRSETYLRDAVNSATLPSFTSLDGYAAYRGGQAFWNWFARRFGEDSIARTLDSLRTRSSIWSALEAVTGLDTDGLAGAWHSAERSRLARHEAQPLGDPLSTPEGAWIASPALSPDGERIAFAAVEADAVGIYVVDRRGQPVRILRADPGRVRLLSSGLSWQPGSDTLAIVLGRGSLESVALVHVPPDAPSRARIGRHIDVEPVDRILSIDWFPDGRALVLSAVQGARSDLFRLETGSGRVSALTRDAFDDLAPSVSPDGARIAWQSDRGAEVGTDAFQGPRERSAPADLYVLDVDTGKVDRVTDTPWTEERPAWSYDGSRLLYLSDRWGFTDITSIPAAGSGTWRIHESRLSDAGVLELAAEGRAAVVLSLVDGHPQLRYVKDVGDLVPFQTSESRPLAGWAEPLPPAPLQRTASRVTNDPRPYRIDFSPDLVFGSGGYDPLYGAVSMTRMVFSDVLGDHRLRAATNLVMDLRRSDYLLAYDALRHRVDWSVSAAHTARILADRTSPEPRYALFRQGAAGLSASLPVDVRHRLDAELTVMGASRRDLDGGAVDRTGAMMVPRVTFTRDAVVEGPVDPLRGLRMAVSVSAGFGPSAGFVGLLTDVRAYVAVGGSGSPQLVPRLAIRFSGGTAAGRGAPSHYAAGTWGWLRPRFGPQQYGPVRSAQDFLFATPVAPLRGFGFGTVAGSSFGLVNAEWRIPLGEGPLSVLRTGLFEARIFADAAFLARRFGLGIGSGLRAIVLGIPCGIDWAWPVVRSLDPSSTGRGMAYFSIGTDF